MYKKILGYAVIVTVLFLMLLFVGCSPKVVTVEKVHTEYVSRTDTVLKSDTVLREKNTIVREARPEDSLLLLQYGIRLRENERMLLFLQSELEREKGASWEVVHDTTLVRDTIPSVVQVERDLTWWERKKMEFGGTAMLIVLLVVIGVAVKWKLP
jgi:hypothetical protein